VARLRPVRAAIAVKVTGLAVAGQVGAGLFDLV